MCIGANGHYLKPNFVAIDWAGFGVYYLFDSLICLHHAANSTHTCIPILHKLPKAGDAHEIADYLNFGGRLGTGQRCKTGLDCATGACSPTKQCHCQIGCNVSRCKSGCAADETCITVEETGLNACWSNSTGIMTGPSNAADAVRVQSLVFFVFQAMVLLRLFFSC